MITLRIRQEITDFLKLLYSLIYADDVFKLNFWTCFFRCFCFGLTKRQRLSVLPLHLTQEKEHDKHNNKRGHQHNKHVCPDAWSRRIYVIRNAGMRRHKISKRVRAHIGTIKLGKLRIVSYFTCFTPILAMKRAIVGFIGNFFHAIIADSSYKIAGCNRVWRGAKNTALCCSNQICHKH